MANISKIQISNDKKLKRWKVRKYRHQIRLKPKKIEIRILDRNCILSNYKTSKSDMIESTNDRNKWANKNVGCHLTIFYALDVEKSITLKKQNIFEVFKIQTMFYKI